MCNPMLRIASRGAVKLTGTIVNYCDSRYLIQQQAAAEETTKQT